MRKPLLVLFIACAVATSCKKQDVAVEEDKFAMPQFATTKYPFLTQVKDVQPFQDAPTGAVTSKFRFRWNGCDLPLGICFRWGVDDPGDDDPEEEASGIKPQTKLSTNSLILSATNLGFDATDGQALVNVRAGKVYIKPNQRIYFSNGTVPISDDIDLGATLSKKFGFSSVIIKKGLYKMRFENDNTNGEVFLEAVTN